MRPTIEWGNESTASGMEKIKKKQFGRLRNER
jgi:hypothetical protein